MEQSRTKASGLTFFLAIGATPRVRTARRSVAPPFLDQLPDADAAQSPLLVIAVLQHLLDYLLDILLRLCGGRGEQGCVLAAAGDQDLLAPSHLVEQLGQVGPGLVETDGSHTYLPMDMS